jgi:hypothetical protein
LWVRACPPEPGSGRGPRWWAFRDEGTPLGFVDFPPRFELHAVSFAGALGTIENEFDVKRVALFRLDPGI